ncbi:MAG: hypothetical protein ACOCQD_03195 [archaeon]
MIQNWEINMCNLVDIKLKITLIYEEINKDILNIDPQKYYNIQIKLDNILKEIKQLSERDI